MTSSHIETAETTGSGTSVPSRHAAVTHLLNELLKEPRRPFGIGLTGRLFINLGQRMAQEAGDDPELGTALRKLIEARDAFARAYENTHMPPIISAAQFPLGVCETFGFGHALDELRAGNRVARRAWLVSAPTSYLVYVPGSSITVEADKPLGKANPSLVGSSVEYADHIDVYKYWGGASDPTVTPWVIGTSDVIAEDWFVYANGEA